MSLFPKKHLIWCFDTIAPSKYLLKFRKLAVFEPFMGYDIAHRGRLSHYGCAERKQFASDLKKIRSDTDLLLEDIEAYQIYMAAKITGKVPGILRKLVSTRVVRPRSSVQPRATGTFISSIPLPAFPGWTTWIRSGRFMRGNLLRPMMM